MTSDQSRPVLDSRGPFVSGVFPGFALQSIFLELRSKRSEFKISIIFDYDVDTQLVRISVGL